jgi:two-component system, cell cycle sensor histidine kinase and response regulator CckA
MSEANLTEPGIEPQTRGGRGQGSLLWLLALALALIGAAVVLSIMRREAAEPFVLILLAGLAVAGVVSLFAIALGILRIGDVQKNDLLSSVFASMPDGSLITSGDGRVLFANDVYRELTGAKDTDAPSNVERAFAAHPDASEPIYRLSLAAREARSWSEEFRIVNRAAGEDDDDHVIWYRISVRPYSASGDHVNGNAVSGKLSVWNIVNVTRDRERQENVFQELQSAIDYLDHAPAGFFSVDAGGQVLYMNATLASWLGQDLTTPSDSPLMLGELLTGDSAELLARSVPEVGDLKTEILDVDFLRHDGTNLPVRLLHRASFTADGKVGPSRTLVLNRSMAEDVAEEVRVAQVRFARFFNNAPFAIATVDGDGRIGQTNAAFARLQTQIGMEAGGKINLLEYVRDDDHDVIRNALDTAAADRADIAPFEVILRNMKSSGDDTLSSDKLPKEGERDRSARVYVNPIRDSENQSEKAIFYIIDTTEQRELEVQVAQGLKMNAIGELAGSVAHDFNNLLTVIINHSDFLLLDHEPSDPAYQDITQIRAHAIRGAGLVGQLLAYSRRQTLLPTVLNLTDSLTDQMQWLGRLMGDAAELDMEHAPDLWDVRVDRNRFEQVVMNLAVNASHAMPDGGLLTIRTSNISSEETRAFNYKGMTAGDFVLLEIEDNGTGMPNEVREQIFDPFFTTKEMGEGTGLGLSTVYGIIKQTEGFIFVESELGKGTKFRIFLPRYIPGEVEAPTAAVAAPQESPGEGAIENVIQVNGGITGPDIDASVDDTTGDETILLVEDDDGVRGVTARILIGRGYTVFETASGVEALEMIDEGQIPDLIVSDVMMPEMDGPTLLKEARQRVTDIRFILMSGHALDSFNKNLDGDEAFTFLQKPFTMKKMAETVKSALQN